MLMFKKLLMAFLLLFVITTSSYAQSFGPIKGSYTARWWNKVSSIVDTNSYLWNNYGFNWPTYGTLTEYRQTSTTNIFTYGPTNFVTTPNATYFTKGVLLGDGRVCMFPWTHNYLGLYYPAANVYSNGPAVPGEVDGFWNGGCVLTNGKVFLNPAAATNVYIYDPVAESLTVGAYKGYTTAQYGVSVLMTNGSVLIVPYTAGFTNFQVYNPATDTMSVTVPHGQTNTPLKWHAAIMLTNGKVLCIPNQTLFLGLYDMDSNTYTNGPIITNGANRVNSACIMTNGKVFLNPANQLTPIIYDPVANSISNGPAHGAGTTGAFGSCQLGADGNVIMVPNQADFIGIYNVANNTFSSVNPRSFVQAYSGSVTMTNGRVLFIPRDYRIAWFDRGFSLITPTNAPFHPQVNNNL